MPLFSYKALNTKGVVVEDTIQATNKKDAATILSSNNLKVLTLKNLESGITIGGGISVSEKANFCRFMAMMLRSGLPLPEALEIIRRESKNKHMQKILADVSFQTRKGRSLSSVLAQYKNDFDPVFLTIVTAGEQSGTLEKSFDYLAKQLLSSYEFSQKVKGSLMYPAVIIAAMIGEGFLMMFFILPRLSSVFLSLNMDLPLATEVILKLGSFIGENTLLVLILAIILGGIMAFLFIYPRTRRAITQSLGRLPAVRKMMNEIDIARFSRTLAILLKSGVPIIQSLDVSANSLAQPKWKEAAKTFSARVAKGESLADVLLDDKSKFPVVLAQAIRTGEETGSMDVVLEELAEFYEREVDYSLKRLTSLLEPVLMLLIGVAVGVMVILMVTPIYSIVGGLDKAL
jgi:type IV pilus assembly protein PilC